MFHSIWNELHFKTKKKTEKLVYREMYLKKLFVNRIFKKNILFNQETYFTRSCEILFRLFIDFFFNKKLKGSTISNKRGQHEP